MGAATLVPNGIVSPLLLTLTSEPFVEVRIDSQKISVYNWVSCAVVG